MKPTGIFFGLCFLLASCSQNSHSGDFQQIGDEICFDVLVGDTMYKQDHFQYLEEEKRFQFIQQIKNLVLAGKLEAYRPNEMGEDIKKSEFKLKPQHFEDIFYDTVNTSVIDTSGTFMTEETKIIQITNLMLSKFEFREDWFFNEKALKLEKKVKTVSFLYEVFTEDGELKGHKKLFTVYLN